MSGREFTAADVEGAPRVAIVNEAFTRKFNLGRDAVGKRMAQGGGTDLNIEIVGVVQDAKYSDVKQEIPPLFFLPYAQAERMGSLSFYLRTALGPEQMIGTVQTAMSRLDPNLPLEDLKTMPQQVRDNIFLDRMISTLSASFAVLATVLAAIGLYGVLAYTVAQRTREFGLRMALGADGRRVRRLVLRQVGIMTIVGGAIGAISAWTLGHYARTLLFEMTAWDAGVFGSAAVLLTLVAFAAGYVPAYRASRVDPMIALRYE
jgi:ABC-type antimicrobial peptide transport system permease subunit